MDRTATSLEKDARFRSVLIEVESAIVRMAEVKVSAIGPREPFRAKTCEKGSV